MQGINPVTFRGVLARGSDEKVNLTIGRTHLKEGENAAFQKFVTAVVWGGDSESPNEEDIIGHVVLDETHFLQGLQHLFPKGELHAVR